MSSNNLVTFEKFLVYGIKLENSDPDSPKIGNSYETSLIAALNTLCEPLPTFRVDNNSPLNKK